MFKIVNICLILMVIFMLIVIRYLGKFLDMNYMLVFFEVF